MEGEGRRGRSGVVFHIGTCEGYHLLCENSQLIIKNRTCNYEAGHRPQSLHTQAGYAESL